MNPVNSTPLKFYETKGLVYIVAAILLIATLNPFGFESYLFILPIIMFVGIYIYPTAEIILYPDHFVYKKGSKTLDLKYSEIIAIHQDPVFSPNLISLYLASKFRMGGFFIETTKGITKYIGAISQNKSGLLARDRVTLIRELERRSGVELKTGEASIFKQKQKLQDVLFLLVAIFVVPAIVIFFYWLIFGLF